MKDFTSISVREATALLTPEPQGISSPLPYRELLAQQAHTKFYEKRTALHDVEDNHPNCTSEVTLQYKYHSKNGKKILLKGRIDLLEQRDDVYIIYEFKSIFVKPDNVNISEIPPRISIQIMLYAYMFYNGTPDIKPENITCKAVLHNLADQKDQIITIPWSVSEIETKLDQLGEILKSHEIAKLEQIKHRQAISDKLTWQFPGYRQGQEDILAAVKQTFNDGGDILINAPTGIGKTLAVLLPALRHSLRSGGQIFYATAKGSGRNPVIQAIKMLSTDDITINTMIIPSQSELCDSYPESCNILECGFYPESWDISNQIDLPVSVKEAGILIASDFCRIAEDMKLCPVILARAASLHYDIVIGDYNFVFSPNARLFQFNDNKESNWTLIVDEAHNLIDRICEEFSFTLQYEILDKALQLLKDELWLHADNPAASKLVEALNSTTASFTRIIEELSFETVDEIELEQVEWNQHVKNIGMLFAKFLLADTTSLDRDLEKALWKAYITLWDFSEILGRDQDRYLYLGDNDSRVLQLCCLDPADELQEMYRRFKNIAAFSGTLTPLDFYGEAMGFGERALVKLDVPGWFNEDNCLITVASNVDTRFNARTSEALKIAKIIRDCIKHQPGGYLTVMPSFEFLNQVSTHFTDADDHFDVLIQKPGMSSTERKRFTKLLKRKNTTTLAFVVAGGQFTEAEDYPGDTCVGVIITSPCLPPPDVIRNTTLAYWERRGEDGHSIAYLYPGIRRVVQAGGRLLRKTDDRGIILLIGDRFQKQPVLGLLPQHWQESILRDQTNWQCRIEEFWLNHDNETIH